MISIGTDCSGIEAPIEALKQLHINFLHKWCCEIDPYAQKSIIANYNPEHVYNDITIREHKMLPDIDVYVCGFPCQPFSLLGKKEGVFDKRSNIMLHCIKVIKLKKPKVFILENVKNFCHIQNSLPYRYLLSSLQSTKSYKLYVKILNTNDYGIPQNRERIYIIGIRSDILSKQFEFPCSVECKPLDNFLVTKTYFNILPKRNAMKVIKKYSLNLEDNHVIACAGYGNYMTNMCPTITCSTPMYLTKYKRYLMPRELLLLQGFKTDFKQVVSDHQLRRQAGNSMSVNVLKALFTQIFKCTT